MTVFQEINTTEPNQMILVSFFSEDNVLSDKVIICYISEYQSNKNQAFCFFWDTRYKPMLWRHSLDSLDGDLGGLFVGQEMLVDVERC